MPIEFQVADEKLIKKKFPYIAKPEYIWVNEQEMQIITFHLLHKELKNEQIKLAIKEIQRMIVHRYPESIGDYACHLDNIAVDTGYFSFWTGGIPNGEYHVLFIMAVHERMMLGTYHCNADYEEQANNMVFQMLKKARVNKAIRKEMIINKLL